MALGQSPTTHVPAPSRAAPGLPRGRTTPDRRDATRRSTSEIVSDHTKPLIVWTLYGHKHLQITEDDRRRRAFTVAKALGNRCCPRTTTPTVRESLVLGRRSLGWRSSTSRQRCQWRLTASRCDGASATIDTTNATSKAARTREREGVGTDRSYVPDRRTAVRRPHMIEPKEHRSPTKIRPSPGRQALGRRERS